MSHETDREPDRASISLSIPVADPNVFRHKATNDVLLFLTNHRFRRFSLRELATRVGHAQQSVRRAVNVLVANELVVESAESNSRLVRINRERLSVPDDPILRIPQVEFHLPVNDAVEELRDRVSDVVAIVLYGSVARGEADRRSDIDLWVLTRTDRAANQREANAVARELEERVFDGERYAYDIDVEAVESVPTYTEDIRELVVSGIPIHTSGDFEMIETLLFEVDADEE